MIQEVEGLDSNAFEEEPSEDDSSDEEIRFVMTTNGRLPWLGITD